MLKAPAFKAEVDLPNCPGVVSAYVWVPPPRRASPPPQKYFVAIDRYRDASTFGLRRAILDQVEASREADEAAKEIDVGATIARMKAAHDALVAYARSRDNAITYVNLLTAYAAFKDDAQKLLDALHAMSSAQKGS